ncbi:MAG: histidinol dehydrogenase [Prolixibacteraceae bacterium]|nr:histidinol dehydrogenase [Prolixibacteraceae bacterium]
MKLIEYPLKNTWAEILKRPVFETSSLNDKVKVILDEIKTKGDKAVSRFSLEFDKVELDNFVVTDEEIKEGISLIDNSLKKAIEKAADNISKFHKSQSFETRVIETQTGVKCWQKSVAIEKVGLYIPGGTAPLFSTVLMLAIPANIAGCKEIILCTPPQKDGKIHPAILFSANLAGVTKIFKIGGIQAIGSMAYGTETVPKVYKIFGPGNQYVTAAKQIVNNTDVAIDMPAGPSEMAIIADDSANPSFLASDLLSQAEHGSDSHVVLITTSKKLISEVNIELENQLKSLPRINFATNALSNSKLILVNTEEELIEMVNSYAPEHLIIAMNDYLRISEKIINAGSVFLGNYTPESAGDYASGTNHTLPTNGWARSFSGVNLDSFIKKITFQEITKDGLKNLGPVIEKMAEAESLFAHKNAVTIRLEE